MSDRRKRFMLGGILFLAIPGSSCVVVHAQGDEERPPIIVDASIIQFSHGRPWKPQKSQKKWKPDHNAGRNAIGYEVLAINKDPNAPTACVGSGKDVTIDFTLGDANKTVLQFTLTLEPRGNSTIHDPTLISPVDLTPVYRNSRRVELPGQEGHITKVVVGDKQCNLAGSPGVQVIVHIQQSPPPDRRRGRGRGQPVLPSSNRDPR